MKKIILNLFIIITTYSCAPSVPQPTMKEKMETWIGIHISQTIQQWGSYTRTIDDEMGGKIYIWESRYKKSSTTAPFDFLGTTIYTTSGGGVGVSYIDVFVNKDGVIERIKWGER